MAEEKNTHTAQNTAQTQTKSQTQAENNAQSQNNTQAENKAEAETQEQSGAQTQHQAQTKSQAQNNTHTTSTSNAQKKTFGFQAEVSQLLHLMIHSLYSNKEIFIRELISNSSDAIDRLKFEALKNPALMSDNVERKIWLNFDKDAHTITFEDNGIGMTEEEAIQNLGTIAKSGTREFLNTLTGDKSKDSKLIGQFGVGFYSAFIVADKVTVQTKRAGLPENEGIEWSSEGKGDFEIQKINLKNSGTKVIVHLKKDEDEFLNEWRLRHSVTKYSDHITVPVVMKNDKGEEEIVNRATALWTLPKNDIQEEQYKELYKHVSHDFEDPLLWSHNKVEGKLEYITLLYIPARAPFDLWQVGKTRGLKLYIQRVFIMDDAEQFVPHYLRFVRGIIDSKDLPLNVSREILQGSKMIDTIKTAIVKRVLGMLEQLANDDKSKYAKFWKEFGQALKEGPAEDFSNKDQIAKLLRFASTKLGTEEQEVSLDDYLARMPSSQNKIYYLTAETFNAAKNSPHLEIFRKKSLEVLLLTDRVDEWLMSHLTEYHGKPFQSVARGGLDLGELEDKTVEEKLKQAETDFTDTLKKIKDTLGDSVKEVRLSKRLTDSPACIVVGEHDMSTQMERLLKAAGQKVPVHKPILELNPDHMMVKKLKTENDNNRFEDWSKILLDQAILAEGGQLDDPASFVKRFNKLMLEAF